MYPYGDAAGDSSIPYIINEQRKCLKIAIPDGGMAFFGKRHTKLYVSINTSTSYSTVSVVSDSASHDVCRLTI